VNQLSGLNIDDALAHSYRDFHAKGLDYICLRRSTERTLKLYFFNGDASTLPDVVHPHDHRYPFTTRVICGAMQNSIYVEHDRGAVMQRFDFDTPLNGGDGFSWHSEVRLLESERLTFGSASSYRLPHFATHTIRILTNETVLFLDQEADVVAIGDPTKTYTPEREPPSLAGLYSRWTADALIARLVAFQERTGWDLAAITTEPSKEQA
jgi:hypothetical protein